MKTSVLMAAILGLALTSVLGQTTTNSSPTLTNKELREYSDLQKKLYPKKGDLYRLMVEMFGERDTYSADQVTAATDPFIKTNFPYAQRRDEKREGLPIDAFSKTEAQAQLSKYEKLHPKATNLWSVLVKDYGEQPWYRADELRDVEENGKVDAKKMNAVRADSDPVQMQINVAERRRKTLWEEISPLHVRQSWRDVLYADDPSQKDNQNKALKDLVGTTFSYVHDGKANTDTWTLNGALLLSWVHNFPLTGGLESARMAVAPSVTVNRVSSPDPKKEVDSMLFRLGIYNVWLFNTPRPSSMQLRLAPVYVTDTSFRASLPGYEVDIEPQWQSLYFPLGYQKTIIPKQPLLDEETDKSRLDYQFRLWLHMEGGDVQDNIKSWDDSHDSFFRLGPSAQFQLNAPQLVFGRDISLTALYSYLPAVSGSDKHNSYWKLSGVLNLFKDEELNRKVSLTAEYQNGGLNFTKEDVDLFTIGLSVLF